MANPFFNAEYYLAENTDVAEAVDGDLEIAEQHYFLHGAGESRKPAPWFDIEFYRASREDLADVPADQLFLHFTLHGIREGLSPMEGVDFDPVAYASAEGNEDLLEAFGIEDVENLTEEQQELLGQHFFAHGYKEGREGGPDIPDDVDPVDRTELAEALKNLSDAEDALAAFLEENPDAEGARDEALLALDNHYAANGSDARLAANIVDAEAALADAQATYNAALTNSDEEALEDFHEARVAYEKGMNELRAAKADRDAAQATAEAQLEAFTAAHVKYEFDAVWDIADTDGGNTPGELGVFILGVELVDGQWVPATDPEARVQLVEFQAEADGTGRAVATSNGELFAGINQLVATVNDWLIESDAVNDQQEIVGSMGDVNTGTPVTLLDKLLAADLELAGATDDQGPLWMLMDRETDLENAHNAVATRQELKDALAAAEVLVDELEALLADEEAAWDALEALGYESIEIIEAGDAITASGEGQIFVYDADEEDPADIGASITGFGEEADDVLYFDASEFTYNDGDIEDGDNNVLEFFLVQDGDNVNILFEKNDYGSAAGEFDTITLVGVDIESVQVDELGFISL